MKLKTIVNFSSGVRHQVNIQKNLLSKYNNILKILSKTKKQNGGRNSTGRITVRHQGSGCRNRVHQYSKKKNYFSIIIKTLYNAKSNSFIFLKFDLIKKSFLKSNSIKNIYAGCLIESNKELIDFKLGNKTTLKRVPYGAIISNVCLNSKTTIAKSAGTFCQIIEKHHNCVKIKLPSGQFKMIKPQEFVTLGYVDNSLNKLLKIGKAGRNRLKGKRPSVRGIAMNPVDHPHGGKSNKGMAPVTPWGLPTKNQPTVKKKYV